MASTFAVSPVKQMLLFTAISFPLVGLMGVAAVHPPLTDESVSPRKKGFVPPIKSMRSFGCTVAYLLWLSKIAEPLSNESSRCNRRRPVRLWASPSSVAARHPMMPSLVDMIDGDKDISEREDSSLGSEDRSTKLPVVFEVFREGQLLQALSASNEKKSLCVVMYSAKFSRICQRAKLKYQKLALEYGDCVAFESDCEDDGSGALCQSGSVTFAYIEWSQGSPLCDHVSYVPHVDIYDTSFSRRPALIASFATMGPAYNFGITLRKSLKTMLSKEPSDRLDNDELATVGEERLRWWTEYDRKQKFGV